jgi:hypothetical protein
MVEEQQEEALIRSLSWELGYYGNIGIGVCSVALPLAWLLL